MSPIPHEVWSVSDACVPQRFSGNSDETHFAVHFFRVERQRLPEHAGTPGSSAQGGSADEPGTSGFGSDI